MQEQIKKLSDAQLVAAYREARKRKEDADAAHKERMEPLVGLMTSLESEAAARLQDRGAESLRCKTGTVFLTTQSSVTVKDKEAFFDYLQQHDAWELADIRAAKKAVQDYYENHEGGLPPGVGMSQRVVAQFRAPTKKV